jgi:hypothetical protein
MLPFIKEGFDVGDRALCTLDKNPRSERLQRPSETGVDIARAEASGQLEVRHWENAYLRPGGFDQYAMIDLLEESVLCAAGRIPAGIGPPKRAHTLSRARQV